MQFIPCSGQPPRFTLEPQDAVLPTTRGNETHSARAVLHCAHCSPNTTVTWYRGSVQITSDITGTFIYYNGTLEFFPLAYANLTEEGVEYHCILSNASGSVISRTAILKVASKLSILFFINVIVMLRGNSFFVVGHFII